MEVGSPKAMAIKGAEVLDDAWKVLCDLSRTTDHEGAKGKIDELAEAAFNKAREIVKAEVNDEKEVERLARVAVEYARRRTWSDLCEAEQDEWRNVIRAVLAARLETL
jgi:hypothetical protein